MSTKTPPTPTYMLALQLFVDGVTDSFRAFLSLTLKLAVNCNVATVFYCMLGEALETKN